MKSGVRSSLKEHLSTNIDNESFCVSFKGGEMNNIRQFKNEAGEVLASAAVGDAYEIGAKLTADQQHESVPFYIRTYAVDGSRNIVFFAFSDEKFTTNINKMLNMALKQMYDVRWDSIRDFMEPDDYLDQFAAVLTKLKLKAVGEADMPSICGQNQEQTYRDFVSQYEESFRRDASFGTTTKANNILVRSYMRRYEGTAENNVATTVVAGMDYNGIEYYSPDAALIAASPIMGIFGQAARSSRQKGGSDRFGHGSPCDAIEWGARNRFLLMTPKEYENEAFNDFLDFVQTFHMEQSLRQRFYELNAQRIQMRLQETARFQGIAQANMQSLIYNQQQLSRTLAQNSAAMSDMIMDSWNKKMASDSRISQARSEAIRGVNVYQNSYGDNVDVSVSADHVYENRYGDVYGVSGNALDQSTLNDLDWKQIK